MNEIGRLLVVDDEAPILHALQRTFEAAGYQVTACADPAEALDRLREKPYQVLSADYMMPGMTGAEFLAQAKALQPETIRILLTAAHDFSAATKQLALGDVIELGQDGWDGPRVAIEEIDRHPNTNHPGAALAWPLVSRLPMPAKG